MQDILVRIISFKESLLEDNRNMISVDIVLAQLPEVIRWLESYELNATSCRYAHYAKYITDSLKGKRHLGALVESEDFNKALKECFYILFVYKVFQYERSQGFRLKLSKVVSGPDFLDSSGVDESRDYLF